MNKSKPIKLKNKLGIIETFPARKVNVYLYPSTFPSFYPFYPQPQLYSDFFFISPLNTSDWTYQPSNMPLIKRYIKQQDFKMVDL